MMNNQKRTIQIIQPKDNSDLGPMREDELLKDQEIYDKNNDDVLEHIQDKVILQPKKQD